MTVNGAAADTDGLHVTYRSGNLDLQFDLQSTVNVNNKSKTFGITGGGATFALGSRVSESGKASLGISSVSTSNLGATLNSSGNLEFLSSLGSGQSNNLSSTNLLNPKASSTMPSSRSASCVAVWVRSRSSPSAPPSTAWAWPLKTPRPPKAPSVTRTLPPKPRP